MKWWKVGIGLLLLVGIVIAFFSVYKASVDGLMKKIGLVGTDFDVLVVKDKLAQINMEAKSKLACDLPSRLKGTVKFFLASDQEQGEQAFYLGEQRINCGASMLAKGDVETGTYEIVKGMGYLTQGYKFVEERVEINSKVCEGLPDAGIGQTVGQILEATSGKVFEIVWDEWQGVTRMRGRVEAKCLDRRI